MTGMPPAFRALMERYCQLGRLLPQGDEVDRAVALEDEVARAETHLGPARNAASAGGV